MKNQKSKKRSVTYILCYKDPNYVRTQSLLAALEQVDSINLTVIKNKYKSVLRYPEVIVRVILSRLKRPADTYFIGFRGHEIFWFIYPFIATKKIIFDEFICTFDWFTQEKKLIKADSVAGRLLYKFMQAAAGRSDIVLSDTELHAERIRDVYKLSKEKSRFVYVGTDESVFYPRSHAATHKKFNVFFYGNMLPLHGIDVILGAIKQAKEKKLNNMHFILVGGKGNKTMEQKIRTFIEDNDLARYITHIPWVEYKKLPGYVSKSQLTLGGPFGNTPQAQKVVTGKTYQFLAMGAPVVIGQIDERVGLKDKQNCLLVKQGSERDLFAALEWAYINQDKLHSIGVAGRKLFERKFSIQQNANTLESII